MKTDYFSSAEFEAKYTYHGDDLGAVWTTDATTFRLWAPTAANVKLNLYKSGTEGADDLIEQIEMASDVNGTWIATKQGDLNGVYYTYLVDVNGSTVEACDPYARTTGVNGERAMVIDLAAANPEGWENDTDPNADLGMTDAVIYELHVRDLSIDESSGIQRKGKYLGLIEEGTKTPSGIPTGLDHMKALGITHLHILPMYDYGSVDESRLDVPQFNWGYDPVNFNVPEGSYSTDPFHGEVRVKEVKQMVKGLHNNGISVVMDVVYNHVYDAESFCFNQIVPVYFSRTDLNGKYSNASACGNDTASERSMVKKYIVDSVKYWADEYHIDGFRFDLVGLIDTDTINAVMAEVHKTHPNVIFYGEGWSMDTLVTKPDYHMTTQANANLVPGFAFFSDTVRDILKGSVFENTEKGFVSGEVVSGKLLHQCFMGTPDWACEPAQSVNYVSCHDNNALIDRITLSTPESSRADRVKMNNLAAAFVLTAQGIPFFQAGEEFLRTKPLPEGGYDHNSYASPDSINAIRWDCLDTEEYMQTLRYYQGLIQLRKAHPSLRLATRKEATEQITPICLCNAHAAAYHIHAKGHEDLFVIFNANNHPIDVALPSGSWNVCVDAHRAGVTNLGTVKKNVTVDGISAMVLVKKESSHVGAILLGAAAVGAAAIGTAIALKKGRK